MRRVKIPLLLAVLLVVFFAVMILSGCSADEKERDDDPTGKPDEKKNSEDKREDETGPEISLTYYGHATFKLNVSGTIILMDPYQPDFGTYGKIDLTAHAVTISHEHADHNYAGGGGEDAEIMRGLTPQGDWNNVDQRVRDLRIYTVGETLHGRGLGNNSIFVFETTDVRVVHLGDLGHTLDGETVKRIGRVDVLLIPVGGHYTLSLQDALEVVEQLSPALVIPMHYRTGHNANSPIGTLEDFLGLGIPYPVTSKGHTLQLSLKGLPDRTEMWKMDYLLP